jgi:hypothetical protein
MGHAEGDFWRWMATWAVSIQRPSDIGGCDDGYILPPCERHDIVIEERHQASQGTLFGDTSINATTVHRQKKRTAALRADAVANLVNSSDEAWLVWCDTNYEADELVERIDGAVEVRGNDSESYKESTLAGFSSGQHRVLITKPTIAGFGMNWQHCHKMAFIGLSYSYEQFYQALRRCWRFGQTQPVHYYVVQTDGELELAKAVDAKKERHEQMKRSMSDAIRQYGIGQCEADVDRAPLRPMVIKEVPAWMQSRV